MGRGGYIYIVTNITHSVLYIGVTSDIISRVWQHKNKIHPTSFSAKYNCNKLVYYEGYAHIEEAIAVEKVLKGGSRDKKIKLIMSLNPGWMDLYQSLIDDLV